MTGHSLNATVLIAESDPGLRHLFQSLLRYEYATDEVTTATVALQVLRGSPEPMVVLWDLWLPDAPGASLVDAIEQEPAVGRHAFVLLTTYLDSIAVAVRERLQRLQIPLIHMPFSVDTILEHLAQAQQQIADGHLRATN